MSFVSFTLALSYLAASPTPNGHLSEHKPSSIMVSRCPMTHPPKLVSSQLPSSSLVDPTGSYKGGVNQISFDNTTGEETVLLGLK